VIPFIAFLHVPSVVRFEDCVSHQQQCEDIQREEELQNIVLQVLVRL